MSNPATATAPPSFPDYPFTPHYFDLQGIRLHYVDEGPADRALSQDAPPILMLHGNPTWSFYYRRLISALRSTHRVIVPDHIGMGLSDKPGELQYEFTLARRVTDLEKLIDSLNLRHPLTLILHDWGGMIGMAYATRHPERIAKIVILNTGGFSLPKTKKMPWQLNLARSPFLGGLLVRGLNAFSRGAIKDCVTRPLPKDVARATSPPTTLGTIVLRCIASSRISRFVPAIAPTTSSPTSKKISPSFRSSPCSFAGA